MNNGHRIRELTAIWGIYEFCPETIQTLNIKDKNAYSVKWRLK